MNSTLLNELLKNFITINLLLQSADLYINYSSVLISHAFMLPDFIFRF